MKLNEFQDNALSTAFYLGGKDMHPIVYCTIGLTEEAGEVAGKVKKLFRDNNAFLDAEQQIKIGNELGDTLWYLSVLADKIGLTLEEVAQLNINKRADRKERKTERGSGDNR